MIKNTNAQTAGASGRIYDYLYDRIVHGDLTANTLLTESELAKQFESSRTPVREALLMLQSGGLVKRHPNRGYVVTEITPQDVDEIFELRLDLELMALRKAYTALSPELLRGLEDQLNRLDENSSPDEYYRADRILHELLAQFCGNTRLQSFLNTLDSQIERIRYISARRPARLNESKREHLDIIHALMDQDLPLATEMLSRHIHNVGESTKVVCHQRQIFNTYPGNMPPQQARLFPANIFPQS